MFSTVPKPIGYISQTQISNFNKTDKYKLERIRIGNRIVAPSYEPYGQYLYRNLRNNVLIASYEAQTSELIYSGSDIGTNSDAIVMQ